MTPTSTTVATDYVKAYMKGRHAAHDRDSLQRNPYRTGSSAFQAWNDGYYDEQSARRLAIERHSALLWSRDLN